MRNRCVRLISLLLLASEVVSVHADKSSHHFGGLRAYQLRCDYAHNPLNVDSSHPRLYWKLESAQRGDRQTAFQVLVASSASLLARDNGDLWNSGKIASGETIQIPYAGRELKTSQQAFWKVRVWGADGKRSAWSETGTWSMGILDSVEWNASWVASPDTNFDTVLMRRQFAVKPGLKRALAYVCGLGQYELTLNGKKAGDGLFSPGWTKYDKTCLYDAIEVTSLLRAGKNTAGIFLGAGMYEMRDTKRFVPPGGASPSFGPLEAIAQLRLEYADGSVEIIGTDPLWRVAAGPITFSSIYDGEDFDARLVQAGWDGPNFDDSKWQPAQITVGPGGALRGLSSAAPPIRAHEVFQPVSSRELSDSVIVYDLGQNVALMPHIVVSGPVGSTVRIIPSELIKSDGWLDDTACNGKTWWTYKLSGRGVETWSPKFFYRGARYLEVIRIPAKGDTNLPVVKFIEGVAIRSSSEPTGEFECSNELFNRIHTLVRWAQRNNMMSVMTDCPQREKRGWLEQTHLNGPALRYEFDLAQLFTKTMNDMADSQLTNGLVPTTAPEYSVFRVNGHTNDETRNSFGDSPEWGSAFILVPWQQYEFDGDLNLFRAHYEQMKQYLAFLSTRATNGIVNYGLGDWYDIGPKSPGYSQLTPIALTATAFYFQDAEIMSRVAALLGKTEDALQFQGLAERTRNAFNGKFFDSTKRVYATGSQTANSVPLVMNICESSNRANLVGAIVRDVRSRGNALTAGDVGYRYLLLALAEEGRSDVIFDINNQSEKPGYGCQLRKGATSLTEAWDANRMSSQDHFMLGQIDEWFFQYLAGIAPDPAAPGFKNIVIHPTFVGNLTWVKAKYDSVRGLIATQWERKNKEIALTVEIPPGATASVYLPAESAEQVREGGRAATTSRGVKFICSENGLAVFEIDSGKYQFTVPSTSFARALQREK